MQLVEQHVISKTDSRYAIIDAAAFTSKNLYNAANYEIRQVFIHQGIYLNYHEMHQRMKTHEAYQALPAKVAQQVLRVLDKNWCSFFAAMAVWREDPSASACGGHGRPKLPKYKDKQQGRNLLIYTTQALSKPALRKGLICPSMLAITLETKQQNVNQVRLIPRHGFYKATLVGIQVLITEESYTSKCSFLDNEPIGKHEQYMGKRIHRGLFRASDGRLINADVNGAYNIIRKVAPDAFEQGSRGCVVHPR